MNWLKQAKDPLFPDVLWSRPENKRYAGKLLIIGGHAQEFNNVSAAYSSAIKAGAGTVRVILPQKLERTLSKIFPEAEYASSNQIGSFSRQALDSLIDAANWSDAVLLAGDFGHNSETAVLLESFINKYKGKLALSGDSLDYFLSHSKELVERNNTLIIASLGQLQKLSAPNLIQQNTDLVKAIGQISAWTELFPIAVVTVHSQQAIVACKDKTSTTPIKIDSPSPEIAAYATVWWMQQPKSFEALTTAIFYLST